MELIDLFIASFGMMGYRGNWNEFCRRKQAYENRMEERAEYIKKERKRLEFISLKSCMADLRMNKDQLLKFKAENGNLSFMFCFGKEHPECGVLVPRSVRSELERIYGRWNGIIDYEKVRKHCLTTGQRYWLVGYLD